MAKTVFKKMLTAIGNATDKASDLIDNLSDATPEMKTVNALAAAFAVLVMADKVAEDEEKVAVSEYLIDMDYVIENNMIREVSTLFIKHIETFEEAQDSDVMQFNIVLGEVLQHIAAIKGDKKAVDLVAQTVNLVTSGGSADKDEIKARSRILKALGK